MGAFPANAFGLHDMHGNVYEWVETCFGRGDNCDRRVLYGGSWASNSRTLRSEIVSYNAPSMRVSDKGFRVVRALTP